MQACYSVSVECRPAKMHQTMWKLGELIGEFLWVARKPIDVWGFKIKFRAAKLINAIGKKHTLLVETILDPVLSKCEVNPLSVSDNKKLTRPLGRQHPMGGDSVIASGTFHNRNLRRIGIGNNLLTGLTHLANWLTIALRNRRLGLDHRDWTIRSTFGMWNGNIG